MQDQDQPVSDNPWRSPPQGRAFNERTSSLTPTQNLLRLLAVVAVAIIGYVGITYMLTGMQPNVKRAEQAKAYIRALMKDPDSSQFKDVNGWSECVTGKVNSKNSYGGYIGFRDFYYDSINHIGDSAPEPLQSGKPLAETLDEVNASAQYTDGLSRCVDASMNAKTTS